MMTQGQATLLNSQIRSFVGLGLVASLALASALIIWHAAFDENPLANLMAQAFYSQTLVEQI